MIDGATLGSTWRKRTRARPGPQRRGRLHEIALLHRQHLAPDDARVHHPARRGETDDDVPEPEPHDGVDGERQEHEGKGELHVGDAHQHGLRPPAEEAGDEAEQPADHRGQQHRAEADEERDAGAVEHARVEVAPELVRAEDVAGRARRLEARHEIALDRVVRRDQGRGEGGDQGHRRQEEAEDAERVALESADHAVSASRRVRGSSQP
jgi:hypothetical protein